MRIELNHGYWTEIDDADYQLVSNYTWRLDRHRSVNYAVAYIKGSGTPGSTVRLHQVIARDAGFGDLEPDHKDGNGLNNHRANLRPATRSQQLANTRKLSRSCKSRYKGVSWHSRGRWFVRIHVNRHSYFIGYFDDEVEAAKVYNDWAETFFGEFAVLNEVGE